MKVGDLVRLKKPVRARYQVFLILRTEEADPSFGGKLKVWIYPDPYQDKKWTDTYGYNNYYGQYFEVVSESR